MENTRDRRVAVKWLKWFKGSPSAGAEAPRPQATPAMPEMVSDPTDPNVGRHLGRYHLAKALRREGKYGIYQAFPESPGPPVTVKILDPRPEETTEEWDKQRLMREMKCLASLDHPGFLRVIDYVKEGEE